MPFVTMKKYNISPEYGIFTRFTPPFHKALFPISSFVLGFVPKMLRSNADVKIAKKRLKTADGDCITLYIFYPVKTTTDKALLYIHGGGFAFKGSPCHYHLCQRFAAQGNCKVVYVDYRLSPKYKYPIPLQDCFLAYQWIVRNAAHLNIDTNKIIVGGDSAGGCLAVDVTLKALQENIVKPCYQMLIYPLLDKRMHTQSMKMYTDTPMWNSKLTKKMWRYYLGTSHYISPNERADLRNMPPAYLETAEYDCLHDEGVEFAKKLMESSVPVTLYETKRTMHGYDSKNCPTTEKAQKRRIKVLRDIE